MVDRLYADPRDKAAHVGGAASYQQYQELKACTFKPEINREVPKQQVSGRCGVQQGTATATRATVEWALSPGKGAQAKELQVFTRCTLTP